MNEVKIGDVLVTRHNCPIIGICVAILQREIGSQYQLSFVVDGIPKTEWFNLCEIDFEVQCFVGFQKK